MQYLRKWDFAHKEGCLEEFDQIEGWGKSYFWYCRRCCFVYARAEIKPSNMSSRIWQAVSGLCSNCPGDKWTIPGTLETLFTVGWNLPSAVVLYQLERELAFLSHCNHPHNQED